MSLPAAPNHQSRRIRGSRADADTDIVIKTASGVPLAAKSHILRTFSSCAEQLPADATEWDVSGLLYSNGQQPFAHATVECWLSCAYSAVHGPAELDEDDTAQLSTAKGLYAVLAFAHAVGSSAALLAAACSKLDSLALVVKLPEQTLELQVATTADSWFRTAIGANTSRLFREGSSEAIGRPFTAQQQQEVKRQVAEQVSMLLHMAHVLRLQPLQTVLHGFIFQASKRAASLLYGVLELVFTADVLDVALGSGTISKETYVNSVLTRPCGFVSWVGFAGLFKQTSRMTTHEPSGNIMVEAQLQQDLGDLPAGLHCQVIINLFNEHEAGMAIRAGDIEVWFPAQLLLGRTVVDGEDWKVLMSSQVAAAAATQAAPQP